MFKFIYNILRRRRVKNKDKAQVANVIKSMAHAKRLHRELIVLAHPDKNPSKRELAEELSELINHNRYNYDELLKLKKRVKDELKRTD